MRRARFVFSENETPSIYKCFVRLSSAHLYRTLFEPTNGARLRSLVETERRRIATVTLPVRLSDDDDVIGLCCFDVVLPSVEALRRLSSMSRGSAFSSRLLTRPLSTPIAAFTPSPGTSRLQ